jgi:hypothetical protein
MPVAQFDRLVVDGVPVYTGPADGDIVAGLVFRVGVADEEPLKRGITALVAELAAGEVDDIEFHVDDMYTTFVTGGAPDVVAARLGALSSALGAIDADDCADLADTVARTPPLPLTPLQELVELRYGWEVCGARGLLPLLCFAPDADVARAWAASRFSRENVVGWSTGPLPAGTELPLPEGAHCDEPEPGEALCTIPSWCAQDWLGNMFRDVVECSTVVRATDALTVAVAALAAEMRERLVETPLREADVAIAMTQWGGFVHLYAGIDAGAYGNDAVEALLGSINDFAEYGPDASELADALTQVRAWASDPGNIAVMASTLALDELRLQKPRTLTQLLDDLHDVDAAQIQAVFADAREQILLVVPMSIEIIDDALEILDSEDTDPVAGTGYYRDADPGDPTHNAELVVGDEGVTYTNDTVQLTTRYDECVAALEFADGGVSLFAVDGTTIDFRPDDWLDGAQAHAAIHRGVPDDIRCKTPLDSHFREPADDGDES